MVYKVGGHWERQFFMAKSMDHANQSLPPEAKNVRHKTVWVARELAERDREDVEKRKNDEKLRRYAIKNKGKMPPSTDHDIYPSIPHDLTMARRRQYEALKRRYLAGGDLWWVKPKLKAQFESFRPRTYIGPIYGHDVRASGGKIGEGHHRLTIRCQESKDVSPGWENSVRILEDCA